MPIGRIDRRTLEDFRDQVQARVGREQVRKYQANGTPLPSYQPEDNGMGASRNLVDALSAVFEELHEELQIVRVNPARRLSRPPKNTNFRHPIGEYLPDAHAYIESYRNDPALDHRLLDCALRTAFRKEGVLDLRVGYLDPLACTLRGPQKNHSVPRVPVARSALLDWLGFAASRGSLRPEDPVMIRSNGRRPDSRYLERMFKELRNAGVWGSALTVSLHWMRTTTLHEITVRYGDHASKSWAHHSLNALGAISHYTSPLSPEDLRPIAEDLFGPLEDVRMPTRRHNQLNSSHRTKGTS